GLARFLAQALAHFHAVQARQHEVEHDYVVAVLGGQAVTIETIGGEIDLEATALEVLAHHFGNVAIVLHDDDQTTITRALPWVASTFSFVKAADPQVDAP